MGIRADPLADAAPGVGRAFDVSGASADPVRCLVITNSSLVRRLYVAGLPTRRRRCGVSHAGLEERDRAALLRVVQRDIGLSEGVRPRRCSRRVRDAGASSHMYRPGTAVGDDSGRCVRRGHQRRRLSAVRQDQREFVAAQPACPPAVPGRELGQARAERAQYLVTGRMAVFIIYRLERVEIHHDEESSTIVGGGVHVAKAVPVEYAREMVAASLIRECAVLPTQAANSRRRAEPINESADNRCRDKANH